ncbi:MAG: IS4 family transposase [Erysipelotrichaceae bacterium]|nr:IS4 family transposase [Erysipelotrichaceae bacterium]
MSKKSYSDKVMTVLDHKLEKLERDKYELGLLTDDRFFKRSSRKLDFKQDMKILMSIGSSSMKKELYRYFNFDSDTVSLPGFSYSRAKIGEKAFKAIVDMMNRVYPMNETYKGYSLIAVDGSELPVCNDPKDNDSHCADASIDGHSSLHINALYDVLNHRYLDCIIQPLKKKHEINAMISMVDDYKGDKAIFMGDRFYGTFNGIEHLRHTGHNFLVRIKDLESRNFIFKNVKAIPSGSEFDMDIHITLTDLRSRKYKSLPDIYKVLSDNSTFDYLDKENRFYEADYRIVRFLINGEEKYETIITNLDRELFPSKTIKELYRLRWQIEISYRHLKYSVGLNALHSKRRDFIRQEILSRMVMFNISMIITDYVQKTKIDKKKKKWEYMVNITMAIFFTKEYIIKRKGGDPPDLENLIAGQIEPIRPDRNFTRNVKSQPYVSFGYRFS